jgi:predicted LPLAT superfamily acyltransferase
MDFDTDIMVKLYWEGVPSIFLPTSVIYPEDGLSHFSLWKDNLRISRMHTLLVLGMLIRLPCLLTRKLFKPGLKNLRQDKAEKKADERPWYQQPERGAYWGMKFSLLTYRFLGRSAMEVLLRIIVFYFFLFNGRARRASRDFLQQVYRYAGVCEGLKGKPSLWDSYRHFYHFSDALVDRVAAWNGDMTVDDFDFPDREKLKSYPKGVVLLSSHLGNMDMCRALSNHSQGRKINVLLHTEGAPGMNRLLQEINPASCVELISVREVNPSTAICLQEKIDAGEWVVIAVDRVSPDNPGRTFPVSFLGRQARLPQGGFVLAALLQCPVYAVFCLKQQGRYGISVECLAEQLPFKRKQREAVLSDVIGRYAMLLERYTCRAPLQWFNFFNFWKQVQL